MNTNKVVKKHNLQKEKSTAFIFNSGVVSKTNFLIFASDSINIFAF